MFKQDGHRCRCCGKAGVLELDHVKPLRIPNGPVEEHGAAWDVDNLQTLCGCHIAGSTLGAPSGTRKPVTLSAIRYSPEVLSVMSVPGTSGLATIGGLVGPIAVFWIC